MIKLIIPLLICLILLFFGFYQKRETQETYPNLFDNICYFIYWFNNVSRGEEKILGQC